MEQISSANNVISRHMTGEFIYVTFIDRVGVHHLFNVPRFSDLTLFDLLKRLDGGRYNCMCSNGNCRQCHIKILVGAEKLPSRSEIELAILRNIPDTCPASRIACQIKIRDAINGVIISVR